MSLLGIAAVSAKRGAETAALPADSVIMQLKSRRDEATPIMVEERKARIACLMWPAAQVKLQALRTGMKSVREGMTQNDFAGLVSAAHARLGFPGSARVQVAEYFTLPHGSMTPQSPLLEPPF